MNFSAYLRRIKKDNPDVRLAFNIMNGNHDFPDQSSKKSIELFLEKHQFSDQVKISFDNAWKQFENVQYATIGNRKKKHAKIRR